MARQNRSQLIYLDDSSTINDSSSTPLYVQLYIRIRDLILDESFIAGDRLPSSRSLAHDLKISRTTVELTFDQLLIEGYIERRKGSGTYVADVLPERPASIDSRDNTIHRTKKADHILSHQGNLYYKTTFVRQEGSSDMLLAPCRPKIDSLSVELWNRTLNRIIRERGYELQYASTGKGDQILRKVLAGHLSRTRNINCSPEQIVITLSTQQSLHIISQLLLDSREAILMEEPGYPGAKAAFGCTGADIIPVPVDDEGLDMKNGLIRFAGVKLAYVTPSHQYPTGVSLGITRRLELLHWASSSNAWIIEDDYDSEFRYDGHPLTPIQSIDKNDRVIYLGTLNKALFPGIRLAYAVLPEVLVDPFVKTLGITAGPPPGLQQAVAAAFIEEGHFASHLRRVRDDYRKHRDILLGALGRLMGGSLRTGPTQTGLHICAYLPGLQRDVEISSLAEAKGLYIPPLSECYVGPEKQSGLLIGYGSTDINTIAEGISILSGIITSA